MGGENGVAADLRIPETQQGDELFRFRERWTVGQGGEQPGSSKEEVKRIRKSDYRKCLFDGGWWRRSGPDVRQAVASLNEHVDCSSCCSNYPLILVVFSGIIASDLLDRSEAFLKGRTLADAPVFIKRVVRTAIPRCVSEKVSLSGKGNVRRDGYFRCNTALPSAACLLKI